MSHRTVSSFTALAATLAAALLAPSGAMAAGVYHPAPTEAGVTYHPEHGGTLPRSQVVAELQSAQRQPGWSMASRGAPWPAARADQPKTRQQVVAELEAAMKHPAWASVSRGAPWPVR